MRRIEDAAAAEEVRKWLQGQGVSAATPAPQAAPASSSSTQPVSTFYEKYKGNTSAAKEDWLRTMGLSGYESGVRDPGPFDGKNLKLENQFAMKMANLLGLKVSVITGGLRGDISGMTRKEFLDLADARAEKEAAKLVADDKAFAKVLASKPLSGDKYEAAAAGHAGGRVYLKVPYDRKDSAKSAGAKWDADARMWYWPGKREEIPLGLRKFYGGPMVGFSS